MPTAQDPCLGVDKQQISEQFKSCIPIAQRAVPATVYASDMACSERVSNIVFCSAISRAAHAIFGQGRNRQLHLAMTGYPEHLQIYNFRGVPDFRQTCQ